MKQLFLLSLFALFATTIFAQSMSNDERYDIAYNHYINGRIDMALNEARLIDTPDGELLVALCREQQGFDRAAIRIYKKLINEYNNPMAAYYYAAKLYKGGHYDDALKMIQKSILLDKNIPESHKLLASIMVVKGERYKAMLSLYYFLLINDNPDNQIIVYNQLISLWRQSAQHINILQKKRNLSKFDIATEAFVSSVANNDSIYNLEGQQAIEALADKTKQFFEYLANNSEDNLDFWQMAYTEFFIMLVPRNYIEPFVYYISDKTYHSQVLLWINDNKILFNEFSLWMEAQ